MRNSTDTMPTEMPEAQEDNAPLSLAITSLLLDGIAHKLNNILGTMIGSADMLADDIPAASPLREDILRLRAAGEQARLFMQRISEFSRGHQQGQAALDITQLLEVALAETQAIIPSGIQILSNPGDAPLTVHCSPADIHLMLRFILEHAICAMIDHGNITICLARNLTEQNPFPPILSFIDPTRTLRLSVQLDGLESNRDALSHLFNPLRGEPDNPTALGIYTARHVARKLGGDILAQDHGQQGIIFHVFLPLAALEEDDAPSHREVVAPAGATILLVEDDQSMATVFQRLLRKLNHEVVLEHDANAALRTFHQNPGRFNLLVTDFFMPDMNGIELIRRLRETHPALPALLCTGNTDSLPKKITPLKRMLVLEKPVMINEFSEAIQRLLNAPISESTA